MKEKASELRPAGTHDVLIRVDQRDVYAFHFDGLVHGQRLEPFVGDVQFELDEIGGAARVRGRFRLASK